MYRFKVLGVIGFAVFSACYTATIETGLPPSPQVIENGMATAWIYGLVPPKVVQTAAQCPNGVAKVVTQLSFVNQLIAFLTAGIFTPMTIKVTCAASTSASGADESAAEESVLIGGTLEEQQEELSRMLLTSDGSSQSIFVQVR